MRRHAYRDVRRKPATHLWRRLRITVLALPIVALSAAPILRSIVAARYDLTELHTPEGCTSEALGISDRGQVVGSVTCGDGPSAAARWVGATIDQLGTPGYTGATAISINDAGDIVGYASRGKEFSHACMWRNGKFLDLGTLGGKSSGACAVNSRGVVVGAADTASGAQRAFVWSNGRMRDLGALSGNSSSATAINSLGEVVGASRRAGMGWQATYWYAGKIVGLGAVGREWSRATGIDDTGRVAGTSETSDGVTHACLFRTGAEANLSVPLASTDQMSAADAMAAGMSGAGTTLVQQSDSRNVFVCLRNSPVCEAVRCAASPLTVYGINARGDIAGTAYVHGRLCAVVLLRSAWF